MPSRALLLLLALLAASPGRAQGTSVAPVGSLAALRADLLRQEGWSKQRKAYARIKELGPQAAPLIPTLIGRLETSWAMDAGHALAAIGAPAVSSLRPLLKRQNTHLRRCATEALGWIGHAAEPAIPDLLPLPLQDPDGYVRAAAALALGNIGRRPRATIPVLAAALDDPNPHVTLHARRGLLRIGHPDGPRRVAAWRRRTLSDETAPLARRCLAAGFAIEAGEDTQRNRDYAADALRKKVPRIVRDRVIESLGAAGAKASWAIPFILDGLKDRYDMMRSTCVEALEKLGPGSPLEARVVRR